VGVPSGIKRSLARSYNKGMVEMAWFVETFYPVVGPIVLFVAIFWFVLGHDRTLLLPFVGSVVLVLAVSFALGIFKIFLISLSSMMVGATLHLLSAAWLSYPIRKVFTTVRSGDQSQS
jgi:hypothetical protein